jgi:L-arabinose isomerase
MNDAGKAKVGLLPLMLEMYREFSPDMMKRQQPFIDRVSENLGRFAHVVKATVCANRKEVFNAVHILEAEEVDVIVVIFIAYATSISSLKPLLGTELPLLLFSTSPKSSMAEGMSMDDIMLNHGVHGYMDLSNVLRRYGRAFQFVAGKVDDDASYKEIDRWARAARAKRLLQGSTIGLAGYTFDGMGDFGIDTTYLNATLGPEKRQVPLNLLAERIGEVKDAELDEEMQRDRQQYTIAGDVDEEIHRESNRVYLGLKRIVEELNLNAFSMHFQGILENPQIRTLPFLAISKLQQQGLAYAGEGDLLGAVGNLMARFVSGDTLFTETFCPDFDGGRIVMGHMGESNPAYAAKTVLRRKKFAFGEALDPVIADVQMLQQRATVINLGMADQEDYQMILYTGEICDPIPGSDDIDMPYFHFKPDMKLEHLLNEYGLYGGTHHVAMVKGDAVEDLLKLAELLRIHSVVLT